MRTPEFVLATLDEAASALARLRKALADVGVGKPEPLPGPDAPAPPEHWTNDSKDDEP